MPRRNRNVHAIPIDRDELADQAEQLAAELHDIPSQTYAPTTAKAVTTHDHD